jgi:hypothetical protein
MKQPVDTARPPERKQIDDKLLRKLWASALPEHEIARRLGCARWTVRRRAIKLGLPSARKTWERDDGRLR